MSEVRIKSVEFRRERERDWQELERLIAEADRRGLHRMGPRDVSRLPVHYRAVLSSLSVARAISLDANLLLYLENLANRAFVRVYGVRHGLGEAFLVFLTRRFPAEVRRYRRLMALAAVFLLLGTAAGWVQVARDQDAFYGIVGADLAGGRDPAATTEELRDALFSGEDSLEALLSNFASMLFTHNAQIGILSFALGFVAGLPVFYLVFTNGQMLGAMAQLHHRHGLSTAFWGWVLPHGVTELLALILCAGAGLVLARALILPGRSTRLENLAAEGRRAGLIVLGAVVMFGVAAVIEGFFRQLVQDTAVRYAVAAATLVLWTVYFTRAGRERPR